MTAHIEWTPGEKPLHLKIHVDIDKDGAIRCVMHELLHVLFYDIFKWAAQPIEETLILALEAELYDYVKKNNRRVREWRNAIDKRHVGGDGQE